MKKQSLIVFLRRNYIEFEFIYPILNHLKKKFNIYFYFENEISFTSLKNNEKNFICFKKIAKKYSIKKITDNFFKKILLKLLIKFDLFLKFRNKLINNIHSFTSICQKLSIKDLNNIKFILSDINTNSQTLIELKKKAYPIKLFLFSPSPTNVQKNLIYKLKKNKFLFDKVDKILVPFLFKRKFFSNLIDTKKFVYIGNTIFANIKKKYKKKKKQIVIAYNGDIKCSNDELGFAEELIQLLRNYKDYKIIIRFHPIKFSNNVLDIFKKYQSKKLIVTKDNLITLVPNSSLFISSNDTAAISYANYFNVPALAFNNFSTKINNDSFQVKKNLVKYCSNLNLLSKEIDKILFKKSILKKFQYKLFNKMYPKLNNQKKYFLQLFDCRT